METAVDFYVLPEGCIANVLSLTTPRDVCKLSLISSIFRSAAESDAVWERFLPSDYQSIISGSVDSDSSSLCCGSKKELYLRLCNNPLLIDGGAKSFSLDKYSGKKCYMIAARDLFIVWGDTPRYWRWFSIPEARFPEVAELISVCWLEIHGKIPISMLSPATLYEAYFVFKPTNATYGFEHQSVEVTVGLGGSERTKRAVYLEEAGRRRRYQIIPRHIGLYNRSRVIGLHASPPRDIIDDRQFPKERKDGWFEIELGEFFNNGEGGGELEMSILEVKGGDWKGGLIVQGIEIRPKRT